MSFIVCCSLNYWLNRFIFIGQKKPARIHTAASIIEYSGSHPTCLSLSTHCFPPWDLGSNNDSNNEFVTTCRQLQCIMRAPVLNYLHIYLHSTQEFWNYSGLCVPLSDVDISHLLLYSTKKIRLIVASCTFLILKGTGIQRWTFCIEKSVFLPCVESVILVACYFVLVIVTNDYGHDAR